MNLAEAREHYFVVREKLLQAKAGLLDISKSIAKAEGTLQKHADAYAIALKARENARGVLRGAAANVGPAIASELQSLCSLAPNIADDGESWKRFENAREALLQANADVSEIDRLQAEAKTVLETGELERAEAHAAFLKWQKNAIQAAANVERFLEVELAGMAPQTQSQDAALEIDREIERPALSGSEPESCQNPQ